MRHSFLWSTKSNELDSSHSMQWTFEREDQKKENEFFEIYGLSNIRYLFGIFFEIL